MLRDKNVFMSFKRRIPVRYEADVAVIGGGMAGVSAAAAAAASGAGVVLVERFAVTGGVLTTGGVANFCGRMEGQGEVFDRVISGLKEWNGIGLGRKSVFHRETLAVVLQELLIERGVRLLLHTRCIEAAEKSGRVTDAVLAGASGLEALRAKQFIDCSGESVLARALGFQTLGDFYRGRWKLPMSMMYFIRHVPDGAEVPRKPDGWFGRIENPGELPMTSVLPDAPGGNAVKIKVPMFDSADTLSLTEAEITARRRAAEVTDYYRRKEGKPWMLDHCAPIIGIREGARIAGDYVLTVEDLRAGKSFADGVALGTFYLDGHKPDDDKRTYILPPAELEVPPYQIPLRSLIARSGKNLMMAGRNLSADQLALSSARVATTCSMMGQAAGVASAMAAEKNIPLRELDPAGVRKVLVERGADLNV